MLGNLRHVPASPEDKTIAAREIVEALHFWQFGNLPPVNFNASPSSQTSGFEDIAKDVIIPKVKKPPAATKRGPATRDFAEVITDDANYQRRCEQVLAKEQKQQRKDQQQQQQEVKRGRGRPKKESTEVPAKKSR